jgi:hypothetical protein
VPITVIAVRPVRCFGAVFEVATDAVRSAPRRPVSLSDASADEVV